MWSGSTLSKKKKAKPEPARNRTREERLEDPLGQGWLGRPTKYDQKYCAMIIEFAREPWGTFQAFAAHIGVHRDRLYEWADKYPEFKEAKAIAKEINESEMYKMGVEGMLGQRFKNSWQSAWIFAMKARFGLREEGPQDNEDSELEFDFN